MFLGSIFRKYKEKEYRLILIKELIEWLNIDIKQKILYVESLEVLDDEWLERFYNKLISIIEILEEDEDQVKFQNQKQELYNLNKEEILEKKQELNSFNMILDNI